MVNLYFWSDYLAPDTLTSFEKLTGIKVHVSYFDSYETLEARMLAGHSGFDVVLPGTDIFGREIRSGAYLPLDKTKLPNLINLDPTIMSKVSLSDPGNTHGVVYMWSSYGNPQPVRASRRWPLSLNLRRGTGNSYPQARAR